MTKKFTLAKINQEIAARGGSELLVKGNGYYYFCEGNASQWQDTMVIVNRLNELTIEEWVAEWQTRTDESVAQEKMRDPEPFMKLNKITKQ